MGQNLEEYEEHRDSMYRESLTLYKYIFENNIKKNLNKDNPMYDTHKSRGELVFYDHSETDARKQFRHFFGFNAGELLRREPW